MNEYDSFYDIDIAAANTYERVVNQLRECFRVRDLTEFMDMSMENVYMINGYLFWDI